MNILEKEIEDIIWEYADGGEDKRKVLRERGLYGVYPVNFRQVDLGTYGRADMISVQRMKTQTNHHSGLIINVLELKKDEINASVFFQALRYCKGLERMLEKQYSVHEVRYRITLIGKSICTTNDFCFMPDIIPQLDLYTYSIDMEDGVRFHRHAGFYQHNEMRSVIKKEDKLKIREIIKHQEPRYYFDY